MCSECGTHIEWSRVFSAAKAPAWSFEHARGFPIGKLARTAWYLLRPRKYWHAITPDMPVRAARLVWMVPAFALHSYFAMVVYYSVLLFPAAWLYCTLSGLQYDLASKLELWMENAPWAPTLLGMGGRTGEFPEGWDILFALSVSLLAALPIHAFTKARATTKPSLAHLWRAIAMLLVGLPVVHFVRFMLIMTGSFVAAVSSRGGGMGYGMLVGPLFCCTRASAYLIVIYATIMWTAYILGFHGVKRGRLAIIIACLLICLSTLCYWAYPFVMWYLNLD